MDKNTFIAQFIYQLKALQSKRIHEHTLSLVGPMYLELDKEWPYSGKFSTGEYIPFLSTCPTPGMISFPIRNKKM